MCTMYADTHTPMHAHTDTHTTHSHSYKCTNTHTYIYTHEKLLILYNYMYSPPTTASWLYMVYRQFWLWSTTPMQGVSHQEATTGGPSTNSRNISLILVLATARFSYVAPIQGVVLLAAGTSPLSSHLHGHLSAVKNSSMG